MVLGSDIVERMREKYVVVNGMKEYEVSVMNGVNGVNGGDEEEKVVRGEEWFIEW